MGRLSFDDWARLARRDRAAFEQARQAAIDTFLATRPPGRRERLERLQWRIDRERERCANPLAACVHLSNLMWDRFAGPEGLAAAWQRTGELWRRRTSDAGDRIIPLQRRR